MAERKRYFTDKDTAAVSAEASRLIAEQTAAFLQHGGRIQHIPNGVSGQKSLAPQQVGQPKDSPD